MNVLCTLNLGRVSTGGVQLRSSYSKVLWRIAFLIIFKNFPEITHEGVSLNKAVGLHFACLLQID